MENKILSVNNLNFFYNHVSILHDINLNFSSSQFISIIGPNGSGKSTLLKLLTKILHINKNKIFYFGKDINYYHYKDLAKIVSYVPQFINADFDFNVFDIVLLGRNPYFNFIQKESKEDIKKVNEALELVECASLINKSINHLSGGEKQKVLIAKALAQDTPILLLDEPTSSLDLHNQIEILDILKKLSKEKLVIIVLHDINHAFMYSDNVIMFNQGTIFAQGEPRHILNCQNLKKCFKVNVEIIENRFILPKSNINFSNHN